MTADEHSHHHLNRRSLLAAGGGLLVLAAAPGSAQAATTGVAADGTPARATGAARASALTQGTTLVHADLHNHTLMSDGDGDPAAAFASMRSAGLDVAALTDHATLFGIDGLSSLEWNRTGRLADAANDPGSYTAIRGFEWSHPLLGHVNVWYTGSFTDLGGSSSMGRLYDWINGSGGVSGFNHPGRELLRFNEFAYDASMREQMVGLEMFNRGDDYLFDGLVERAELTAERPPQRGLAHRPHRGDRRARHRLGLPRGQGPNRALGRREHPERGARGDAGAPLLRHPGQRAAAGRGRGRRTHGWRPADRQG